MDCARRYKFTPKPKAHEKWKRGLMQQKRCPSPYAVHVSLNTNIFPSAVRESWIHTDELSVPSARTKNPLW